MDVFIYFLKPTGRALDEIEDALDKAFLGRGEVKGSGVGEPGSSIDMKILEPAPNDVEVLGLVRRALQSLHISARMKVRIDERSYEL